MTNEPENAFSFRKAQQFVRKLRVSQGDVILIKAGSVMANERDIGRLADALGTLKIEAIIAVVDEFDNLTVLNEDDMRKLGWIRTTKLEKIIPTRKRPE